MSEPTKENKKTEWMRPCPTCGKERVYSREYQFNRAVKNNSQCHKCTMSSAEHRKKLSLSRTGRPQFHCRIRPYEVLYNILVYGAKRRNIFMGLTYEEFLEFTNVFDCTYCGTSITWGTHTKTNMDRKDSSLGYTKDNCCVCCKTCNSVKNNIFSHQEALKLGKVIKEIMSERNLNLCKQ
jgi:hypothetical protein